MNVKNGSAGWLVLWFEPLGMDYWLRPGETLRIRSDYVGDEPAFTSEVWEPDGAHAAGISTIIVWVDAGDCLTAVVINAAGQIVECGYQRPDDAYETWSAACAEESRKDRARFLQAKGLSP